MVRKIKKGVVIILISIITIIILIPTIHNYYITKKAQKLIGGVWGGVVLVTHSWKDFDLDKEGIVLGSGAIISNNNSKLLILTNRHNVDCIYLGDCSFPHKKIVKVRTNDGELYNISKIYIPNNGYDLAFIEINTPNSGKYHFFPIKDKIELGEYVIALGYRPYNDQNRIRRVCNRPWL